MAVGDTAALPGTGEFTARVTAWRAPQTPWLDPTSGEPLESEVERGSMIGDDGPAVQALIEIRRGQDPATGFARLNTPTLFDRRTGVRLSGNAAWMQPGAQEAVVSLSTGLAHRAELMLEIPLCYGDSPALFVEARSGAELDLGVGASLRVEWMTSGELAGTRGGPGGEYSVAFDKVDPDVPSSVAVLSVWPRAWADALLVSSHTKSGWSTLMGSIELNTLQWWDRAPPESLRVRVLPKAVRLQFELPTPVTMPEVKDLFDLPAPETDRTYEYWPLLEQRLQISLNEVSTHSMDRVPAGVATSGEALKRLLMEQDARYEASAFAATTRENGLLEQISDWVRGLLP